MSSARPVAWILLFAPFDRRAASEFTALKACVVVAHQAGGAAIARGQRLLLRR
jgi:hypothetical protein